MCGDLTFVGGELLAEVPAIRPAQVDTLALDAPGTLAAKQAEISAWLRGNKPQLKLKYSLPENVGITVSKGVTGAVDSANLRLILRLDSSMPNGYRVHTG